MEFLKSVFTHPAFFGLVGGLLIGLVFLVMSWMNHLRTKKELRRFQKHLSEKLEIEGEHMGSMKDDLEKLRKENENLRMKIGGDKLHNSEHALERELELFARAEKSMVVSAPGFAPAWESAKDAAHRELVEEEQGKSLPRRIFRKFFAGGQAEPQKQLMAKDAEVTEESEGKTAAAASSSDGGGVSS
jgi:hypothetical protein